MSDQQKKVPKKEFAKLWISVKINAITNLESSQYFQNIKHVSGAVISFTTAASVSGIFYGSVGIWSQGAGSGSMRILRHSSTLFLFSLCFGAAAVSKSFNFNEEIENLDKTGKKYNILSRKIYRVVSNDDRQTYEQMQKFQEERNAIELTSSGRYIRGNGFRDKVKARVLSEELDVECFIDRLSQSQLIDKNKQLSEKFLCSFGKE